jgi:hypothetical protein
MHTGIQQTLLQCGFVQHGFDYIHENKCKQFAYKWSARHALILYKVCLMPNFVLVFYIVPNIPLIFCLISIGNLLKF